MTKDNEIEELTNVFRTLILQQRNLEQQLTRLNESILNTNERLNLLIDTNQETDNETESVTVTEQPETLRRGSFEVGDRVIVTNRYQGLQGTK